MRALLAAIVALWPVAQTAAAAGPPTRFTYNQIRLGTQVRLVLYAADEATARTAAQAAYAEFERLESIFSDYRPASELSRLCDAAGGPPVPVSPELFELLQQAVQLSERTGGAFDVTVGPFVRLWRQARETLVLPSPEALAAAAARIGWRLVRLDPVTHTVQLAVPGMRLDVGGIAKGYIVDRAMAVLRAHGIRAALIEAGGDILVSEPPPGRPGWVIVVPDLKPSRLTLARAAISTSGDTQRYVEIAGVRYSHIVDPRTGIGLTSRVAATVMASDATTSDGLATACCVLDAAAAKRLVASVAGARLFRRIVAGLTPARSSPPRWRRGPFR